ncbi:MAG: hypothetical protein K9J37_21285 [Saprospiraceae bacterium]|nr:hypothetical protein [Saprospiraceae bacterium]MCF8252455.1 hypothetical protein [Saprospiraceae bacterium]MCF8282322.1 hypothetical protein [Bacteroidales bacterium]MCF8314058.1 hypothetical protein [Saprospiraceae bacterium]MCF8442796.1 hypothetical protein [Saprospiraceae bacterium]
MKTFYSSSILILFSMLFSVRANAQWDLLTDLLGQDQNGASIFFNYGDSIPPSWNPNLGFDNDLFNQLNNNLNDSIPPIDFDGTLLGELGSGFDTLLAHLPNFGFSGPDEDTLLGDIDWIGDILTNNYDSLGGLFGGYHDSLSFDEMNWDVIIIGFDTLVEGQFDDLNNSIDPNDVIFDPNNPGNFAEISGKLFDVNLFPDIELAFGTQNADLQYWGMKYNRTAKVVRIGSVPRFDREVFNNNGHGNAVPLEARWHVQASWVGGDDQDALGDANANVIFENRGFNPLLMFGDYAIMATPHIGRLGNTSFRLITSLGTEFGTYAPAHQGFNQPFTNANKGYMTGLGAQAGAGFAFTNGPVTVYSIGTYALGQALRSPRPYAYKSRRYEVGMRYSNIVNVRYSSGLVSWQDFDNRLAKINHQFTIGIILAELHH